MTLTATPRLLQMSHQSVRFKSVTLVSCKPTKGPQKAGLLMYYDNALMRAEARPGQGRLL
jgi:hypothetical protein